MHYITRILLCYQNSLYITDIVLHCQNSITPWIELLQFYDVQDVIILH